MKMIGKKFTGYLVTSALALAGTLALAQDQEMARPPATSGRSARQGRRHMADPGQQAQRMAKKLKLNAEQQSQLTSILTAQHDQVASLRNDTSMSKEDRRARMLSIYTDSQGQIRGMLTDEQKQAFDQLQQQRRERIQNRKG